MPVNTTPKKNFGFNALKSRLTAETISSSLKKRLNRGASANVNTIMSPGEKIIQFASPKEFDS